MIVIHSALPTALPHQAGELSGVAPRAVERRGIIFVQLDEITNHKIKKSEGGQTDTRRVSE